MAESNQKSIISFFAVPKRPRPEEPVSDNTETRQSKSTRISLPISIDFESDNPDSDIDDIYKTSEHQNKFTSLSTTTTEVKRCNTVRLFLWKDRYLNRFPWLRYDDFTGKTTCSYRACNMCIHL